MKKVVLLVEIAELFKAMQEGFTKLENGQLDIKTELEEVKQRLGNVEIKLEVVENKIDVISEVQTSHKQQGGRELEVMIEEQRSSSTLLGDSLKNVSADVK